MKKWIFLFLALVLVINVAAMSIGCKAKGSTEASSQRGG